MKKKRHFSSLELRVAPEYVNPSSRRRWLRWGGWLAAGAVALAGLDFLLLDASMVSNGPLSSHHAEIESDCSACHSAFRGTPGEKCSACHEKHLGSAAGGDLPRQWPNYGFRAHYVYRSDDLERAGDPAGEVGCAGCHGEHRGRGASISRVADSNCLGCHAYGSFADGHPDFLASRGGIEAGERPGLHFPHPVHIDKVLPEQRGLKDQQTCFYCHQPNESGRGFQRLSFERHCGGGCHLNHKTNPLVALAREGLRGRPGALRPSILKAVDPLAPCLDSINPGGFSYVPPSDPRRVRQTLVRHEDCWIVENLRVLRRGEHTDLGLGDLLAERPAEGLGPARLRDRYRKAIEALSGRLAVLRRETRAGEADNPPAAERLLRERQVDAWLERAELLLRRPGAVHQASLLASDPASAQGEVDQLLVRSHELLREAGALPRPAFAEPGDARGLVRSLTLQCRECHPASLRGLAPAQADQRAFRRAEFDHRPHLVQDDCLSCHGQVVEQASESSQKLLLPSIDNCRGCHDNRRVASDCVTCHVFHPDKDRRIIAASALEAQGGPK